MNTTPTLFSRLISRFRPATSSAHRALAAELAGALIQHPGLADRVRGLQALRTQDRSTALRRAAQAYRMDLNTSETADALCRLTNPCIFEHVLAQLDACPAAPVSWN